MSTAFSIARDVFAVVGVVTTAVFAVVFSVAFARDRKRQQRERDLARLQGGRYVA